MSPQCGLSVYITCPEVVHSKKVVDFDTVYGDVGSHNNLLCWCIVLQVHSIVAQFGIVCVGLLLLRLYCMVNTHVTPQELLNSLAANSLDVSD